MAKNSVWDFPTRFIHWCFPFGIGLLWWTGETGRMEWHSYVGYTLVVLVATRFAWGFVGSFHSRFRNFVRGPGAVMAYLRGSSTRMPERADRTSPSPASDSNSTAAGHNPLGAYSTLALLSVLLLQGVSGMFSIDDVAFDGPLAYYFEGYYIDFSLSMARYWMERLQGLVALHLVAIAWYQFRKHQPLIQTMWFGSQPGRESEHAPAGNGRAIMVVAVLIAVLATAINFAPEAPSYY